jgi:hypothetical protein
MMHSVPPLKIVTHAICVAPPPECMAGSVQAKYRQEHPSLQPHTFMAAVQMATNAPRTLVTGQTPRRDSRVSTLLATVCSTQHAASTRVGSVVARNSTHTGRVVSRCLALQEHQGKREAEGR